MGLLRECPALVIWPPSRTWVCNFLAHLGHIKRRTVLGKILWVKYLYTLIILGNNLFRNIFLIQTSKKKKSNKPTKTVGNLTLFCFCETNECIILIWWKWLPFLVSFQGVRQRFFMTFYSSCASPLKIICSQVYILPKSDNMNKVCLWSEGYFSLARWFL